jgi:hypothetical protein
METGLIARLLPESWFLHEARGEPIAQIRPRADRELSCNAAVYPSVHRTTNIGSLSCTN